MTKVTFRQLDRTLKGLGFESIVNGDRAVFRHEKKDAILTVPTEDGAVRDIYVVNARRQVANSGIASADAFEAKLASN